MKKLFLLLTVIFFAAPVFAQSTPDGAFDEEESAVVDGIVAKQHIKNKKHMQPAYVREANVMWSKTIWRMIDLREKQNLYLYYPINPLDDRRSLVQVLIDGINEGDIYAYSTTTANEFDQRISIREAYEKLGVEEPSDSIVQENPETGEQEVKYVFQREAVHNDEVRKILVKEVWFFDRKYCAMKCRILGLCPIMEVVNEEGNRRDQKMTFWVYYPQAAQILSEQEAFSYHNDAQRQSLYDCFEQRKFGSYIYRESNVFDNRIIGNYAQGMSQNIEAERIQNEIFQKEHDMWEF